jgi:hypothetical protein
MFDPLVMLQHLVTYLKAGGLGRAGEGHGEPQNGGNGCEFHDGTSQWSSEGHPAWPERQRLVLTQIGAASAVARTSLVRVLCDARQQELSFLNALPAWPGTTRASLSLRIFPGH